MLNSLFSFIVALGILVFFHELGHYLVARFFNVQVLRFSIGFGRPILSWTRKKTGEQWTISWIPLGGYVRMMDERDADSVADATDQQLKNAFNRKPVLQRIAIVVAGPFANLLLASLLYAFLTFSQTQQLAPVAGAPAANSLAAKAGLKGGDRILSVDGRPVSNWNEVALQLIRNKLMDDDLKIVVKRSDETIALNEIDRGQIHQDLGPRLPSELGFRPLEKAVIIYSVMPDSPAAKAGMRSGDQVVGFNGKAIESSDEFTQLVRSEPNKAVTINVLRDGEPLDLQLIPKLYESKAGQSWGRIGVALSGKMIYEAVNPTVLHSLRHGFDKMVEVSLFSVVAIGKMIAGGLSWSHLNGPISIASAAGESSSLGILPFIGFLAMVSVSLGILNLLPIPVLDGGHLMYYFAELLIGKPVSEVWVLRGQKLGLAMIGALTFIAFFNDLRKLF